MNGSESPQSYIRFHLRFGWWGLLTFLTLGIALEAMLGLKIDFYLNVDNDVRRLVWRLAHAHGTLLSLVHLALAATLAISPETRIGRGLSFASLSLISATVLIPGGFFAGGFGIHQSDPGIGIYLVPLGAVLLFLSVLMIALSAGRAAVGRPSDSS